MTDAIAPAVVVNTLTTSISGVGIVIFGVQTGLDYPTLIAGVIGAATALSYLQPASILRRSLEIISGCLFAGYSAPVFTHMLSHVLAKFDLIQSATEPPAAMQLATAFLVGYMAHSVILPGLRKLGISITRRATNE